MVQNKTELTMKDTNPTIQKEASAPAVEEVDINKLFKSIESIDIHPDNAKFYRSVGNLVSLDLIHSDGSTESFEKVNILRSFPMSNPDEFLSVREPDTKNKGRGKEIGIIRKLSDFDEETVGILKQELDLRYFTPQILKIYHVKEKFGYSYWDVDTSAGHITFVLPDPFSSMRFLDDGRLFITDIEGNVFLIPDLKKLDKSSYRKIEVFVW